MQDSTRSKQSQLNHTWLTTIIPGAVVPVAAAILFHQHLDSFKWVHLPFHSLLESVGAVAALILALFIITMRNSQELKPSYIWVATSLMGMGLLDGFHASVAPGNTFVWLHSLAVFVGGVTFALVVLPESISKRPILNYAPVLMAVFATTTGLVSIVFPHLAPNMLADGNFTLAADALNIIGGLGFVLAWYHFIRGHDTNDQLERHLLANHTLLFGTAGLLFHFSLIWDATWWLWHILRFIAYIVILGFFLKIYLESVTRIRETKLQLEHEKAFINGLIEHSPALISLKDTSGDLILTNSAFDQFSKHDQSLEIQAIQANSKSNTHSSEPTSSLDHLVLKTQQAITTEADLNTPEGKRTFISSCFPLKDSEQNIFAIGHILTDISERKEMEQRLMLSQSIIDHTNEGIIVTDTHSRIVQTNIAYQESMGYSEKELLGKNPSFLQSGKHDKAFYQEMWQSLHETGHWAGELWDKCKNGEVKPHWLSVSAIYDANKEVSYYVGIMHDISKAKSLEAKLEQLAYYDALTGLPNRIHLKERLEQNLADCQRNHQNLAVLLLDLDNFKIINDSLGHSVGDEVLKEAAFRLFHQVRETDTVARLGGDEFVIVLNNIKGADCASQISNKIIETLKQPLVVQNTPIQMQTSIGIALYPNDGTNFETLLKNADLAMYSAKTSGKSNYHFFSTQLHKEAQLNLELKQELETAITENQFEVFYQPKVDLNTQQVVGAEALIRWRHPTKGLIFPNDFIPFAENSEQIIAIGQQVLQQACQQIKQWSVTFNTPIHISVNLSTKQFRSRTLLQEINEALAHSKLPPAQLELEITESSVMDDVEKAMRTMQQLCELGIELSIDDFGTGYSSLGYLKRFPIQTIKIDRSFVQDIHSDMNDRAIVEAIISLGEKLGLKTIAEGIEEETQLLFLKEHGCHLGQGYYFSKPLSKEDFEAYLEHKLQ